MFIVDLPLKLCVLLIFLTSEHLRCKHIDDEIVIYSQFRVQDLKLSQE